MAGNGHDDESKRLFGKMPIAELLTVLTTFCVDAAAVVVVVVDVSPVAIAGCEPNDS